MNKLAMHFSLWIFTFHPNILFLLSLKSQYYKIIVSTERKPAVGPE